MKKIISYNVNGIRAAIGKGLIEWIRTEDPDIVCLQETKAQPDQIPVLEFEALGYHTYWYSAQKRGYSGVGLLTKIIPDQVVYGMGIDLYDNEGRVIRADYGDISVLSVYHPSGSSGEARQDFKMIWLGEFLKWSLQIRNFRPNLVVSGDFNICHKPIDIHDPVGNAKSSGFLPEEREWMSRFLDTGFVDSFRYFNQEPHQYSWWSFRANARARNLGWRIDYHMVTRPVESLMTGAAILPEAHHSDHCPILLEMDF